MTDTSLATRTRPRSLAFAVVEALSERLRHGELQPGDKLPTEAQVMSEFGVSRTVVREALSRLQAAQMVVTKHGIGTFVAAPSEQGRPFSVTADQLATLQDVVEVLELRVGLESEAASLAALRRTSDQLGRMRAHLDRMAQALAEGSDAVDADFSFHLEIAQATHNARFVRLLEALGTTIIPRARLQSEPEAETHEQRAAYLRRVHIEHESIFDAISAQDSDGARATMRMHLVNSQRRRKAMAQMAAAEPPLNQQRRA
jgi:GntR family transcriptional regulator, transcriptional repressor for pyruvate dehydrogenase complex